MNIWSVRTADLNTAILYYVNKNQPILLQNIAADIKK